MNGDGSARVRYHDQQILRTKDFIDEQAYHVAQRRRHNIGGHSWGIVAGLEVVRAADGELSVQAGMAIDGYGRELILPTPSVIEADIFANKGSDTLDVYLEYAQHPVDRASPTGTDCPTPDELSGNRLEETASVLVRRASQNQALAIGTDLPARRQPPEVPPEDLRFSPARVAPDDPGQRWPVFLGQLRRIGAQSSVDLRARPYAGLVGELVTAPSGWAWLQVGEREGNDYRFGVFLAKEDPSANPATPASPPLGPAKPTLGVRADGEVEIRADTTLSGDLIVDGGAVEFCDGPEYQSAHPWRIYRTHTPAVPASDRVRTASPVQDQLRIEMAAGDGDGAINEVVVGHWSEQSQSFVPCLTVSDDCRVTVSGNLEVNGTLTALEMKEATASEFAAFAQRTLQTDDTLSPLLARVVTSDGQEEAFFASLASRMQQERGLVLSLAETIGKADGLADELIKALASLGHPAPEIVRSAAEGGSSLVAATPEIASEVEPAVAEAAPAEAAGPPARLDRTSGPKRAPARGSAARSKTAKDGGASTPERAKRQRKPPRAGGGGP